MMMGVVGTVLAGDCGWIFRMGLSTYLAFSKLFVYNMYTFFDLY